MRTTDETTTETRTCPDCGAVYEDGWFDERRGGETWMSVGPITRSARELRAPASLRGRGGLRVAMNERLLRAREVAEALDVSPETVLRWTRRGELPAVRLPSGGIRYRPEELDDWLVARATTATTGREVSAIPPAAAECTVPSATSAIPAVKQTATTEEDLDAR
jgi:excisionase family DNA binding protein